MPLKLLVCGDVKGKLDELYKKVALIEKKSDKFDTLFCVGDFFGTQPDFINNYINQQKSSSIETFIISSLPDSLKEKIDEKGSEICRNITYLGFNGVLKFENKLHIAFVSSENVVKNDLKVLSNHLMCTNMGYAGIDILFTCQWPAGIENGSEDLPNCKNSREIGNGLISALTALIQPRYHFTAGQEIFYERQPYKNQKNNLTKQKHATRFIALSSFNNKNKDKCLYALQLNPMELMTQEELWKLPINCTDNPFATVNTDTILSSASHQFFYENPDRKRKATDIESTDNEKKRRNNTSNGCWFCLGNPEVEKHLLVYIGKEVYIAMPRGALNHEHMMILSVGHFQSLVSCPKYVLKEIKSLMKIISNYFSTKGKSLVFFERNFKNQHFQLQSVPIDSVKLEICKNKFLEMAGKNGPGRDFTEIPRRTKLEEIVKPNVPYFYVEFSDKSKLFGTIHRSQFSSFDIQFGRYVLCAPEILNCPEKVEWKNCVEKEDVEKELAKKLRNSLAEVL